MRDDLLHYYEEELRFLRRMGVEFAQAYPKIASRLVLEPEKCEDPHVERLLEGFAFLAARVHLKINDDFPEIIESLLGVLYPHYIRPIPSMSIVQFHLDPEQGKLTSGLHIGRNSILYSQQVGGMACKFRTAYDTTIWPVVIASAEWKPPDRVQPPIKAGHAFAALVLRLRCFPEVTFEKLDLKFMRFYVAGEGNLVNTILELLANNCMHIVARDPANPRRPAIVLQAQAVKPVGFAEDDGMLPYPHRSFAGYRILQEYFTFPEKFSFFDLTGMESICGAGFQQELELVFLISPFQRSDRQQMLETGVHAKMLALGCSPVINLFQQTADPILLEQTRYEYQVIPDVRRQAYMDVFSIDEVLGISPESEEPIRFDPVYSYRNHGSDDRNKAFWHATRRPTQWRGGRGSDVYITLVDLSSRPVRPEADTLSIKLTCTNRDLPSRLPFGAEQSDFQLEGGGPISRIVALVKPTDTFQAPLGKSMPWRLLSQLSLNYLSIVENGREALQEILRLHNFTGSAHGERQIQGITNLRSERRFARVVSDNGISYVQGASIDMELDEEQFVGGGVYTFASVLEQFFALYVSLNSFSQLTVRTRQRKEVLRQWPPRSGQRALI